MSFKTYRCPSCKEVVEESDLHEDVNAKTGDICEECCPHCGTWFDDKDIIHYE